MNRLKLCALGFLVLSLCGCALQEVRSKSRVGPEFRTKGGGASRKHSVRWDAQSGVELEWDNGISTGVTYRRRDEDNGTGDRDNAVWFELTVPLWRSDDHPVDRRNRRISELERRVAQLEAKLMEGETR